MDILKTAQEWAREEVFSSLFFIVFGAIFVAAAIGFWQFGKTDLAKLYLIPALVAGGFLLVVGFGLFFLNKSRDDSFAMSYEEDATAFVQTEVERTQKSMNEYEMVVFKVIPFIIIAAALTFFFVDKPLWRAICVTTIAMMSVIMIVDSNAHARLKNYNQQLIESQNG